MLFAYLFGAMGMMFLMHCCDLSAVMILTWV